MTEKENHVSKTVLILRCFAAAVDRHLICEPHLDSASVVEEKTAEVGERNV